VKLYGIIGYPLTFTLSPPMHNAGFRAMGIHARYDAYAVKEIQEGMKLIRERPLEGASVTIPHKVSIKDLLDELDDSAVKTGAINTVVRKGPGLTGFNTDVAGAVRALEEKTSIEGKKILLAGAGGSARAIAWGIGSRGGKMWVANRDSERGEALAREFGGSSIGWDSIPEIDPEIIINATPVMPPVPREVFGKNRVVMDITYGASETGFLQMAESRGCTVIDGLRMLLYQGLEQFRLWTGLEPPRDIMEKALYENHDTDV
jgi:shikimate dehydrogenase